jgi:hypothetical protein
MAFSLPTFNLSAGIYTGPWVSRSHRISVDCNLSPGRRVFNVRVAGFDELYAAQAYLLVPALTDIRDLSCGTTGGPDFIQVPAGSGRWYFANGVDDVAKGFANEYRLVTLAKIWEGADGGGSYVGANWPVPIP